MMFDTNDVMILNLENMSFEELEELEEILRNKNIRYTYLGDWK